MAASVKTNPRKYRNVFTTLSSLTKTEVFPFVVRVSKSDEASTACDVAGGTEILIQSLLSIECAKVRVLHDPYTDEINEDYNGSRRKDNEEYLIPTKNNGKVNFVAAPGDRRRYSSVDEVIEYLPRYVRVEEDIILNQRHGISSNYVIPTKTVLRLVRKFVQENRLCLEVTDEVNTYVFETDERIKFTAEEDKKSYRLYELSRMKLLPRAVQFIRSTTEAIPLLDYELDKEMSAVVNGPVHLLGFLDVKLLVGWVRDKPRRTYETVVIPSDVWDSLLVQKRCLTDSITYIQRKYGENRDTDFVEKMLVIPLKYRKVIWLGSPNLFKHRHSATFEAVQTRFEDSSENDTDDAEDISDDSNHDDVQTSIPVTTKLPKAKLKRSLFAKVHAEILSWFRPARHLIRRKSVKYEASKTSYAQPASFAIETKQSYVKHPNKPRLVRSRTFHVNDTTEFCYGNDMNVTADVKSLRRQGYARRGSCDNVLVSEHKADEPSAHDHTLHIFSSKNTKKETLGLIKSTESDYKNRSKPEEPTLNNADSNASTEFNEKNQNTEESIDTSSSIHGYLAMDVDKYAVIMRKGCTADDFYHYSVIQTASCFRLCALCDLAELCYINRLNGYSFKHIDLSTLRDKPFYLNSVQILKVYKIIHNGWRPFVE